MTTSNSSIKRTVLKSMGVIAIAGMSVSVNAGIKNFHGAHAKKPVVTGEVSTMSIKPVDNAHRLLSKVRINTQGNTSDVAVKKMRWGTSSNVL